MSEQVAWAGMVVAAGIGFVCGALRVALSANESRRETARMIRLLLKSGNLDRLMKLVDTMENP